MIPKSTRDSQRENKIRDPQNSKQYGSLPFPTMSSPLVSRSIAHLLLPLLLMQHSFAQESLDRSINRLITSAAFRKHQQPSTLSSVELPASVSRVTANVYSYRASSLARRGATIGEFKIPLGVFVHPPAQRILLIHENMGHLSSIYQNCKNLSGFRLLSPVIGLLVQSSEDRLSPQLDLVATKEPILVNFSSAAINGSDAALCASFGLDGGVEVFDPVSRNVCATRRQGLFGLVIRYSPATTSYGSGSGKEMGRRGGSGRWTVVVLGLGMGVLVMVVFGGVVVVEVRRRRRRLMEMRRRVYEDELLQMSMVGHLRVPVGPSSSTVDSQVRVESR